MKFKSCESLGICIGASSVSEVWLNATSGKIYLTNANVTPHHGNPKEIINKIFSSRSIEAAAVTGRSLRTILNLTSISEPEAIEIAIENLNYKTDIVISVGGENFIVYELDSEGRVSKPYTGNKCSSGTGEFFLQQIKRMNLDVDKAVSMAVSGEPHEISGRCSVFCKSDCTHALNKGVPKSNVVAGLTKMMAQKVEELASKTGKSSALIIGGVSQNTAVMNLIAESFKNITIPPEAKYFEAFGAAVYALQNDVIPVDIDNLIKPEVTSFSFHDDLKLHEKKVSFKTISKGNAEENDELILGLDVGSTTTKAVLLRSKDNAIVAAEYLRTNGDPVTASVQCYSSLRNQLENEVRITGLGVTGSGRYIAGLHAQTKAIINEIIAHAEATLFFDKDVDTIFEIGGQDAKYTYITAGVPSDYAMNEACSAGTGSFLEEAAKESLNIDYTEIGDIARKANRAPNFNDQCSAFISSDIKNALHEGLTKEEIVAGLVYSICLNYTNRVKGNRPVGKKVFMQGGVCYNKAVPVAMAALTGKEIIVPPEPGLMGAFGVALEVKKRMKLGLLETGNFDLDELIIRTAEYGKTFTCAGGAEKCDRRCEISMITVGGKKYPFGGACNKYYNLQKNKGKESVGKNLVLLRQKLVFEKYIYPERLPETSATIGISKSFLNNTFYPLFFNFFTKLGFDVVLGKDPRFEGMEMKQAAFCYPAELAHGFMKSLTDLKPDYIFMPHIVEIHNENSELKDKMCVFVQSENYYLRSTFKNYLNGIELLSPILNFSEGYKEALPEFIKLAKSLNRSKSDALAAFEFAFSEFSIMLSEFRALGREALKNLEADKESYAVVLMGRPYNAFAEEANLGIPQKFSSRNVTIIPYDFLEHNILESSDHMYWGMGRTLLRTARFIKNHDQLFAAYITNFSCGPDSFLIGYFRNIMGKKPSLTLELDSHSADAGLNTRVEAFLDIINSYKQLEERFKTPQNGNGYNPLLVKDLVNLVDSDGKNFSIFDPDVKMVVPNMGEYVSAAVSASFRHCGIKSEPCPVYTFDTLKLGRGNTLCKECLPLILTAGSMLEYFNSRNGSGEKTLYFMTTGDGPCRQGQYRTFLNELIRKKQLENIGVYSLTDEDSYQGLGPGFERRSMFAIFIADAITAMHHAMKAIAVDSEHAIKTLKFEWGIILEAVVSCTEEEIYAQIEKSAAALAKIEKKCAFSEAPMVSMVGEIFVRQDEFSRIDLMERLAERGIIVQIAPINEFIHYANHIIKLGLTTEAYNLKQKLQFKLKRSYLRSTERKIKKLFSVSGFCDDFVTDIDAILKSAEHLIKPEMLGEAILTVGTSLHEILDRTSGVISIGPFGCMPSRVAESILNMEMTLEGKASSKNGKFIRLNGSNEALPFLAIETDGNLFPQIIRSRIEIFLLQTERLHKKRLKLRQEALQY